MIMICNQKEVFIGDSLKRFNEICVLLSFNRIEYKPRIFDKNTSTILGPSRRARTGTFGENMAYSKTYYIYVHKNDYDNAIALLRK